MLGKKTPIRAIIFSRGGFELVDREVVWVVEDIGLHLVAVVGEIRSHGVYSFS